MGVGGQPLWEVQWHSGSGGRVRRLVLTRRGGRVLVAVLGLIAVLVLGIVGILPIGVRGVLERITVRALRRENRVLRVEQATLRERALVAADALHAQLGLIYCLEPVFASALALFLPAWFSNYAGIDTPTNG